MTSQTTPSDTQFVDLDNARYDEQREVMKKIIKDDVCPFCSEQLEKYHKEPVLKRGKFWIATANHWPYEHTQTHLLFILIEHATKLSEIPAGAGDELIEFAQWAEKEFAAPGGGFSVRFGDTNFSAGSVDHLHAQFIVPDWNAEDFEPVRVKLGKTKTKK